MHRATSYPIFWQRERPEFRFCHLPNPTAVTCFSSAYTASSNSFMWDKLWRLTKFNFSTIRIKIVYIVYVVSSAALPNPTSSSNQSSSNNPGKSRFWFYIIPFIFNDKKGSVCWEKLLLFYFFAGSSKSHKISLIHRWCGLDCDNNGVAVQYLFFATSFLCLCKTHL